MASSHVSRLLLSELNGRGDNVHTLVDYVLTAARILLEHR